jgi:hypothetical protein
MRLTLTIIVLILLTGSCGEKIFTGDVNCDECYTEKPVSADLVINLTINNKYPRVPIIVYKGDVEDSQVVSMDTADHSPFYVYVPVNENYAVKAEYSKDDAKLFAIDGTKLKLLVVTDACDAKCYVIEGESLDARIKNDFLDF